MPRICVKTLNVSQSAFRRIKMFVKNPTCSVDSFNNTLFEDNLKVAFENGKYIVESL